MPRYFVCQDDQPVSTQFDHLGYYRCGTNEQSTFIEVTEDELSDLFGSSGSSQDFVDLLFTMQLSTEEHLLLMGAVALFFATCWAFSVIGRQINPR